MRGMREEDRLEEELRLRGHLVMMKSPLKVKEVRRLRYRRPSTGGREGGAALMVVHGRGDY